jgi:hypothetical protein
MWHAAAMTGSDGEDSDGEDRQPPAAAAADGDGAGSSSGRRGRRGTTDQEVLALVADGVLSAGRGSGGSPDVLQVHVTAAGPFSKRGTYRWACEQCKALTAGGYLYWSWGLPLLIIIAEAATQIECD